jgi:hypothetical protein
MWEYIFYIITHFLSTFIIYVTHYNNIFENEYSLNRTWQKIVEFKLNYLLYKIVNHVLI